MQVIIYSFSAGHRQEMLAVSGHHVMNISWQLQGKMQAVWVLRLIIRDKHFEKIVLR